MKNKLVVKYLMPLVYSLFFSAAMSALLWITVTYGSLNAVPIAVGVCAILYSVITIFALVNLFRGNKLFAGSSAEVFSVKTQKMIRVIGITAAVPALIYCAMFFYTLKSYGFQMENAALVDRFAQFEMAVFGQTKICDFIAAEYGIAPILTMGGSGLCPAEPESEPAPTASSFDEKVNKIDDVDFGPYMADVQRKIKRAWFPPSACESSRVMVHFKVKSDGSMSELTLLDSASVALIDQAALKAVSNAAPFRPLPAGAPSEVDVQFTFDYNVFGADTSKSDTTNGDAFATASSSDSFSSTREGVVRPLE